MMLENQLASLCARVRTLALLSVAVLALSALSSPAAQAAQMPDGTPQQTTDDVVSQSEVAPEFPGGAAKLYEFLGKKMIYPEAAAQKGVQGRVIVQFVVEKDGSVSNAKVVKGVDKDLDAEAIRVVKLLPKFTPGKTKGQPVRVWFTLPLTFKIN